MSSFVVSAGESKSRKILLDKPFSIDILQSKKDKSIVKNGRDTKLTLAVSCRFRPEYNATPRLVVSEQATSCVFVGK